MATDFDPIVNNWYARLDKGQKFVVIAVDEEKDAVEIQHFDGDVEEMDIADWRAMDLELSEPPENWSGPVEITEADDYGTQITETTPEDWSEPMSEFRDPEREKLLQEPEEPADALGEGYSGEEPLEGET